MLLCHFAYNPTLVNKPKITNNPSLNRRIWRNINGGFTSIRGTPRKLASLIRQGHPYTASHGAYRHARHFIMGQTLSLDFDTGDERSSFEALRQDNFIANHATFLYSTPSHEPESPRSRAVFVLDEPVRNPAVYADLARSLVMEYKQSDQSCKDPARIFFGSLGCNIEWIGNRMSISDMSDMLERLKKADELEAERRRNFSAAAISEGTVKQHVDHYLTTLVNAPDGERHLQRLKTSKLIGGIVAAGHLDFQTAQDLLLDAALQNTDSPEDLIAHDIKSGLRSGLSSPVQLRRTNFADWGIQLSRQQ